LPPLPTRHLRQRCPLSVQIDFCGRRPAMLLRARGHPHWLLAVPLPFSRSDDGARFLTEGGASLRSRAVPSSQRPWLSCAVGGRLSRLSGGCSGHNCFRSEAIP